MLVSSPAPPPGGAGEPTLRSVVGPLPPSGGGGLWAAAAPATVIRARVSRVHFMGGVIRWAPVQRATLSRVSLPPFSHRQQKARGVGDEAGLQKRCVYCAATRPARSTVTWTWVLPRIARPCHSPSSPFCRFCTFL